MNRNPQISNIVGGIALAAAFIAILWGVLWVGGLIGDGSDGYTTERGQALCEEHFGDEWEMAGIAKHDEWTHYHVRCERDEFIGGEERWLTVPAEDFRELHN